MTSYLIKFKQCLLKNKFGKFLLIGGFAFFFIKGLMWMGFFIFFGLGMYNFL